VSVPGAPRPAPRRWEQRLADQESASYDYRLRLAENVDEVLAQVQVIAPWTEATNLTDLYGTCDDVANESDRLIENAVARFSGAPDEQVSEAEAEELIAIAEDYVC
jgi:hypothetical protein